MLSIATPTLTHLMAIREHELRTIATLIPANSRILEIGAGTGWQARELSRLGHDVSAIDVEDSMYRSQRVWNVIDYDGINIPFQDQEFGIVFSSSVLEHVPHVAAFQKEIHRVLGDAGTVIHVLPSSSWRFWTSITCAIRHRRFPRPHGTHSRNAVFETIAFSRWRWRLFFKRQGWRVERTLGNSLCYTGYSLFDSQLDLAMRYQMSRALGSACNIFILKKACADGTAKSPDAGRALEVRCAVS